jgi:hypothetical protein
MTIIVQKCYSNITKLVKPAKLDFKALKQGLQAVIWGYYREDFALIC